MNENAASMTTRYKRIGLFTALTIIFTILISGCGPFKHDYVWTEYKINDSRITTSDAFIKKDSVSLINAQPNIDTFLIAHLGAHRYYGSLNQLTEAVITHLKKELRKHNITVSPDASKTIQIKVVKTDFIRGGWKVRANLEVNLKAGNNYTKDILASNSTPTMAADQAFDGAVALAVIDILNNPDILAYLQE
ncbi:MAG: hypothetical protein ABIJ59_01310 [Pseudomonadota bacterium]